MKIFIISRGIPSKREPQRGCFEFDQARGLAARGHEVVVLSVDTRFRLYKRHWGIKQTTFDGVEAYDLCYPPFFPYSKIPTFLFDKVLRIFINKLFSHVVEKEGMPDVVHAHYLFNMMMGVHLKNQYKIPLVVTEHWSKVLNEVESARVAEMGGIAYSEADRVLAVSSFLGSQIKRVFGVDCTVVPNAVDTSTFSFSDKPKPTDCFAFAAVGNLLPIKGFDLLIQAFHAAGFPDTVSLKIIGGGELREALQRQIDELGLSKRVQLTGRIERSTIAEILEQSHALILSSRSETFGVVLIEAMAMGLPVVATDCGGTVDIVDPSNGILVPVEDVNQLSNAMKEMVEKASSYDSISISENCKNKFSREVIAQQMELLYQEVVYESEK